MLTWKSISTVKHKLCTVLIFIFFAFSVAFLLQCDGRKVSYVWGDVQVEIDKKLPLVNFISDYQSRDSVKD